MTLGQRLALNLSPLLLRLALAFVFIYAGAGKLFYKDMPVEGAPAAWLANHGFVDASKLPSTGTPLPVTPPTAVTPPVEAPTEAPVEKPASESPAPASDGAEGTPGEPATPEPDDPGGDGATAMRDASAGFALIRAQDTGDAGSTDGAAEEAEGRYRAADFSEPVTVARRLALVLMMHEASERGDWPAQLSSPMALGLLSWMAVLTEFVGGWLILLGFLTRFWALGLAGTMLVAMWLTQIAPSIGTDGAFLGFLPELKLDNADEWGSWHTLQMQVVLMLASLAVFFAGPGKVSLDSVLFRRSASKKAKGAGDGGS